MVRDWQEVGGEVDIAEHCGKFGYPYGVQYGPTEGAAVGQRRQLLLQAEHVELVE